MADRPGDFFMMLGVWGDFSWGSLASLFAVAVTAGCIDAIAGGGGLLCVPTLLWAGLSPAATLATNKLQGSFGTFSATLHFVRAGAVEPLRLAPTILSVFGGAIAGTLLVQTLDPGFLRTVLPLMLVGIAAYFLLSPRIGEEDRHQRLSLTAFTLSVAPAIGFYDGFFGPGTGSFFAIALVALLGYNLTKATAHTKLLNLTSNIASLLAFLLGGKIVWSAGLVMAAGQFFGARLGSHLVLTRGAGLVRPLLVVMSLAITARLVAADTGSGLHRLTEFLWRRAF